MMAKCVACYEIDCKAIKIKGFLVGNNTSKTLTMYYNSTARNNLLSDNCTVHIYKMLILNIRLLKWRYANIEYVDMSCMLGDP